MCLAGRWVPSAVSRPPTFGARVPELRPPPGYLDLLPEVARFQPPATIVEKRRLSAFSAPELASVLNYGRIDTLIVTDAETDVCVLASVLGAVDRGYRVILVEDAI
jgi:nicotinamidase-related amidase